ncbi:MAG: hypothetical protein OXP68_05210 [Anaerolineaceae bacterium]|nr:hypothetical protein [Anaerolineaceae bacterium]
MALTEHTLNDELGNLLDRMRRRWRVQAEPLGEIEGSAQRPDILITEDGALPLIIEHEISPARTVEQEARERIGLHLRASGREIRVAIALRSPSALTYGNAGAALRRRWLDCEELNYVMYRRRRGGEVERWPAAGWLSGTLRSLALFIQQAMRPGEEIDALADILERRIEQAAAAFSDAWPHDDARARHMLAEQLRLEDDGVQTRRMAMAILANALIFQQSLAPQLEGVEPPSRLFIDGQLTQGPVLRQWRAILKINYWPIFHVAAEILAWMDQPRVAANILDLLHQVNIQIEESDAARSHDLTGFVFQRLIADRKFLATFYTRPESAALLAALALPQQRPLAGAGWDDALTLSALQIGDFACGTGTLLSAVYNRLGALHELHGGDAATLHKDLLEQALVGCDVLPMALHLTLTMLASAYPEIRFDDCHMLVMPYGRQQTDDDGQNYSLGALDLLAAQEAFPTWSTRPGAVGGSGETSLAPEGHLVEDGSFDLVIMNPPFTRPTGHEGQKKGISVPSFAALGTSSQDQRAMSKLLSSGRNQIPYHGNAGLASAFIGLADNKLRQGGTLALVLPLSFLSGSAWEDARVMLLETYHDIMVVTIAGEKAQDKAFSADTGLGECLLIAKKGGCEQKRARFLTLKERPRNELDGLTIGQAVHHKSGLRTLEDDPTGGTDIQAGADEAGQLLDCPLPKRGAWQYGGILDFALAQSSFRLAGGTLLLPRMRSSECLVVPVARLCNLVRENPTYHMDISSGWENVDRPPRAPFDIKRPTLNPAPTWPVIWAHNAQGERCMEISADSEAIVRRSDSADVQEKIGEKAASIWATATRAHINRDFRFNSQSLCVAMTETECIGGHAWPSVIFPRERRSAWEPAFAVWCNSTLGILLYWWESNRQQGGRGRTSVTAIPDLPTLDLRALDDGQLAAAARIFEDMKHCPLLPVNQIDEDPVRAELDRRLLTEVLGLPAELCAPDGPMALLRRKLAAEPSIHGGKKSKVTLDVPEGCLPQCTD